HGFNAELIPNLIDLENYPYRHRRQLQPRLLWMRSFHPLWNPEMALRVFRRVHDHLPHAVLVMAGQDKGFQAQTMELARDLNLGDAVRFPGFLNEEAKIREGSTADIFLNTNRVDNMPVSVVEACALGLPVVATKVGGIPDLLTDGDNALLVPDNDDVRMADGVLRLLNDPDLAGRLSANARRLAEQSAWKRVGPEWQRVITPHTQPVAASLIGIA
ncbi:MAG: glycosyltransferase, partial [Acidobacteria bacterium]